MKETTVHHFPRLKVTVPDCRFLKEQGAEIEINGRDLTDIIPSITKVTIKTDCGDITRVELSFIVEDVCFEGKAQISEEYITKVNEVFMPFGYSLQRSGQ